MPRSSCPRVARLLAVLAAAALPGCMDLGVTPPEAGPLPDGAISPDGGAVVNVAILALAFQQPNPLEIPLGTTVRWTNFDPVPHTVTEGAPAMVTMPVFDSPLLGPGDQFDWTFLDYGEFTYWCRTHPNIMFGYLIRVR